MTDRRRTAAQNAEALARRSTVYASESAASWQVRFDRREPATLRELVRDLRRAYQDEVPGTMHRHAVDDGGTPAYAGEFAAYLYGSPMAVDTADPQPGEVYRTPFRAALERTSGTSAAIVRAVVVAGDGPVDAAVAAGVPEDVAKMTSEAVLRRFWRGMSSFRLPVPSSSA